MLVDEETGEPMEPLAHMGLLAAKRPGSELAKSFYAYVNNLTGTNAELEAALKAVDEFTTNAKSILSAAPKIKIKDALRGLDASDSKNKAALHYYKSLRTEVSKLARGERVSDDFIKGQAIQLLRRLPGNPYGDETTSNEIKGLAIHKDAGALLSSIKQALHGPEISSPGRG